MHTFSNSVSIQTITNAFSSKAGATETTTTSRLENHLITQYKRNAMFIHQRAHTHTHANAHKLTWNANCYYDWMAQVVHMFSLNALFDEVNWARSFFTYYTIDLICNFIDFARLPFGFVVIYYSVADLHSVFSIVPNLTHSLVNEPQLVQN